MLVVIYPGSKESNECAQEITSISADSDVCIYVCTYMRMQRAQIFLVFFSQKNKKKKGHDTLFPFSFHLRRCSPIGCVKIMVFRGLFTAKLYEI